MGYFTDYKKSRGFTQAALVSLHMVKNIKKERYSIIILEDCDETLDILKSCGACILYRQNWQWCDCSQIGCPLYTETDNFTQIFGKKNLIIPKYLVN